MTTNNTDGAALLPVTAELLTRMSNQISEWEMDEPRSDWWQYQRDFSDAHSILSKVQSDQIIAGIASDIANGLTESQSHSLPGDVETLALVAGYADYKAISDDRWEQGKAAGYRELGQLVAAALSTPQEYDGEAVREALETAEETLDQILDDMRDGLSVCKATKDEAIETLETVRAALAHPAQARDEMREAAEEARDILGYIFECCDDHHAAMKAENAWRKLDAALSSDKGEER